jgi:heterodisulfide reductase subunit C
MSSAELLDQAHLSECYQCGKCSAGCPVAGFGEGPPSRILRLLQLGQMDAAVRSPFIWQCVSCQTCSTRCPQSFDCAGTMDALRQRSVATGAASPAAHSAITFQQAFLDNIRRNGRLNEIELIVQFKMGVFARGRSLSFLFRDAGLAGSLQKRGKLHLIGEKARDRAVVQRIFARTVNGGAQ